MSFDQEGSPEPQLDRAANVPLKFRMLMPSDPRLLSVVRRMISQFAAIWGFDKEQCRRITLAVDEALANVIRHAYKNRCDREVELNCQADTDCLEVTFVDRGEPADPAKFCAQALDDVALSGRGTHLIRQIMDEVCYERMGEGNRLRLRKYLPGAKCRA
jgi:anti-sigma regulatory factor (Ser/Thr protein kinase)